AYLVLSAGAHVVLSSWVNFAWIHSPPQGIDGGPLGFLTWSMPALVGTLACDAMVNETGQPRVGKMLAWSAVLMVLGDVLSCVTRLYDVPAAGAKVSAGAADNPVLFSLDGIR